MILLRRQKKIIKLALSIGQSTPVGIKKLIVFAAAETNKALVRLE